MSETEDDDSQLSKKDVSLFSRDLCVITEELYESASQSVLHTIKLLIKWTRPSHQKNRRRRNRKKRSKQKRAQEKKEHAEQQQQKEGGEKEKEKEKGSEVEIEYITEEPEIYDPNYIFFKRIFEAFKVTSEHNIL